jgi:hypothetical protein
MLTADNTTQLTFRARISRIANLVIPGSARITTTHPRGAA